MVASVMQQLVDLLRSPIPPVDEQIASQIERLFCRADDLRFRDWIHRRYPRGQCPTCDSFGRQLNTYLAGLREGLAAEFESRP